MRSEWAMVNGQWAALIRRVLVSAFLFLCVEDLSAQKISTLLSKEKIVIGEQVTLRISVEGIDASQVQQDFIFPDTVNHFEILSDSIDGDGPDFIHTLTITSFDSGYWKFPAYEIILPGNRKLISQSLDITVLPADISHMADYHDIKDILDVEAENNWWIIASIVALGLLSLFAFLWVTTNKVQEQKATLNDTDVSTLYQKLLKDLERWQQAETTAAERPTSMYKEIARDTRAFIDAVKQQNTAYLTTGEYMLRTKGILNDASIENEYFQFLRLADAVKFAKYHPPANETQAIFPVLKKFVTQMYEQNKTRI